jgi:hypothetical protein
MAGQRVPAPATSSGSGGTRPGGLSFGGARSMERSLGSVGSEGVSGSGLEGGDDLTGVAQPNVEQHQQQFVRYSGLSEGGRMLFLGPCHACPCSCNAGSMRTCISLCMAHLLRDH